MIQVKFTEPTNQKWLDWKAEAKTRTAELCAAVLRGEAPKIDEKFYRRRRDDFDEAFHGKCAYCEQLITTSQRGDIDHFRPKKGVLDKDGKQAKVRGKDGKLRDHPGYYWLAYDSTNLVLACIRCNQGNKQKDGTGYGKLDFFPVEGDYASKPGEEVKEKPLFMHPVHENPEPAFIFDEKTGIIGAVNNDPRALWCVERLGLNRERLPERRLSAYTNVSGLLEKVSNATIQDDDDLSRVKGAVDELLKAKKGANEFTFVFRRALNTYKERVKKLGRLLGGLGG